jgi:DNA-binding NarL/FixJ family response regulator
MRPIYELTEQERTVLSFVAKGWRNAAIARELVISTRTVETHLYHIFDKLSVSSRTEAALVALHSGLVLDGEISGNSDERVHGNRYSFEHKVSSIN